jgi:hypothetical protein
MWIIIGIIVIFVIGYFENKKNKEYKDKQIESLKKIKLVELNNEKNIKSLIDNGSLSSMDNNKNKGDKYERKVGRYLSNKGFFVSQFGFKKGKKDNGIDIIAISLNDKKRLFIQCKNWTNMMLSNNQLEDISIKLRMNSKHIHEEDYIDSFETIEIDVYRSNGQELEDDYFLCIPTATIFMNEVSKNLIKTSDTFYIYNNKLKIVIV